MDLIIRNATIAGQPGVRDIGIKDGRIIQISDRIEIRGAEEVHAQGYLVAPGFMDVHMHLDKTLVLDRYDWSEREKYATPRQASVSESNKVKQDFTVEDVRERAIRLAQMCIVNGTTTLRSHVDIDLIIGVTGMRGLLAAKEACREWIDMQLSPYAINGFAEEGDETERLLRKAIEMGADLMGGVPEADPDGHAHVDRVFAIAKEYNLDIDFHCDQAQVPSPFALPHIAEKAMTQGWQGRVQGSHCYGLAHVTPEQRKETIEKCCEAGVSICCTPYSYVQERMIEPVAGGVNVTYMSDNIQDTWTPFGNADMLQLALFTGRLGSWRTNDELDHLFEMGSKGAARSIGVADDHGMAVGKRADLVVFKAKSGHEAIITQARRLLVIKNGRVVVRKGKLLVKPTEEGKPNLPTLSGQS